MLNKRGLVTASLWICASILGWAQNANADRGRPDWSKYADANANKVTICHKSGSVKFQQLSVAGRALPAHLAHGDCVVDDGVACTVDRCDANLGCVHAPDNGACDDGNACTDDTCDPTTGCVYTPVNCDDGDNCTADSCDPASGCRNIDIPTCGACCLLDGSCTDLGADECTAAGGQSQGAGTQCASAQCTEACCSPNAAAPTFCEDVRPDQCDDPFEFPLGAGTSCAAVGPAPNACTVACCLPDGSCQDLPRSHCLNLGGELGALGSQCASTQCTEACCLLNGLDPTIPPDFCEDRSLARCSDAFQAPQGPGSTCAGIGPAPNACTQGACCLEDGSCQDLSRQNCLNLGGQIGDPTSQCATTQCTEACCSPNAAAPTFCEDVRPDQCDDPFEFPLGPGSTCATSNCTEACCFGATCEELIPANCTARGGVPQGPGIDCGFGPLNPCAVTKP